MKRSKKRLLAIIAAILCAAAFALPVAAQENDAQQRYDDAVSQYSDQLPDAAEAPEDYSDVSLTDGLADIWSSIRDGLWGSVGEAAKLGAKALGVIILSALCSALAGKSQWTGYIGAIVLSALLCGEISGFLSESGGILARAGEVYAAFFPAFAGVAAGCGQIKASAFYSAASYLLVYGVGEVIKKIVVPLISAFCALAVCGALTGEKAVNDFVKGIFKAVRWIMSAACVLFAVICSLQTGILAAGDAATLSAGRFVIGSSVPVVGSALSESLGTVFGSMRVIKSAVGVTGIIAAAALVLPIIVKHACFTAVLWLLGLFSEFTGEEKCAAAAQGLSNCMTLNLSALAVYGALMTFLTASLIKAG